MANTFNLANVYELSLALGYDAPKDETNLEPWIRKVIKEFPDIFANDDYEDLSEDQVDLLSNIAEAVDEEDEIELSTKTSKKTTKKKVVSAKKKVINEKKGLHAMKKTTKKKTTKKKAATPKKKTTKKKTTKKKAATPKKKTTKKKAVPAAKKKTKEAVKSKTRWAAIVEVVQRLPQRGATVEEIISRSDRIYQRAGGKDNLSVAVWATKLTLRILGCAGVVQRKKNKYYLTAK
jgi:sRNA-binding protein